MRRSGIGWHPMRNAAAVALVAMTLAAMYELFGNL